MIAVSECLLGVNCKYNGGNNYQETVIEFLKEKEYISICPEVMGGLTTPRVPCEIVGKKVINREGEDCTKEFQKGAMLALELCQKKNVTLAILQARSPSCGSGVIYDGTFTGKKKKGDGVTAKLLKQHGIQVISSDEMEMRYYQHYETEIGTITLCATDKEIVALLFGKVSLQKKGVVFIERETALIKEAKQQLDEYFQGRRKEFTLPLLLEGTKFQREDWQALRTTPYGETRSYKQIAEQIGCPKGCRAVGMANNKNPISIIIPCHRVRSEERRVGKECRSRWSPYH